MTSTANLLWRALLAAVLCASLTASTVFAQSAPPRYDPAWHGGIAAGSLLASVLIVARERHRDPVCTWCGLDENGQPHAPGVDRWAYSHWHWKDEGLASAISHGTVTASIAWPLVALTAVHGGTGGEWGRDQVVAAESTLVGLLSADVAKRFTRRSRPGVVFNREPIDGMDDVHSFFSSHASTAFAAVATAGTIATRRHSRDAGWIWAGGLGLAATTSYLRVAATRHYFTDVFIGSAVGAAIGITLPRLFDHAKGGGHVVSDATPPMAGIGPAVRLGRTGGVAPAVQFAAGARSLGVVGTIGGR